MPQRPIRVSRTTVAAIVAALLALLAAAGLIQVTDDAIPPAPAPAPTVQLDGPGHSSIPAPPQQQVRAATDGLDDHAGSRAENVLQGAEARERQEGLEDLAREDQLPLVSPDAAPTVPGCTSRFVRNFSTRGGVAPRELVAHYTVSRNTPGWSDVWAIVSLFDRAAFAASSNFVIDSEGHCAYIVRDTDKAWTQAAANPFSVSIEFIAMGNEGSLSAAALAKGGQVFAIEARKWGIPIRLGAVRGCLPTTPGIVDHAMLGACGGGHHDLKPFAGASATDTQRLQPLIQATATAAAPLPSIRVLTKAERAAVECLQAERRTARRHGGWSRVDPSHLKHASSCKAALRRADQRITAAAARTGWARANRRERHDYIAHALR